MGAAGECKTDALNGNALLCFSGSEPERAVHEPGRPVPICGKKQRCTQHGEILQEHGQLTLLHHGIFYCAKTVHRESHRDQKQPQ